MVKTTTSTRNGTILSAVKIAAAADSLVVSDMARYQFRVRWEDGSENLLSAGGSAKNIAVGDSVVVDVTDGSLGRSYGPPKKVLP